MMPLLNIYWDFEGKEAYSMVCFFACLLQGKYYYDHSDLLATVFLVPTATTKLQVPFTELLFASTVTTPFRSLYIA